MKLTLSIIRRDYTSFIATITPLVVLGMATIPYLFGTVEMRRTYGRVSELNQENSSFFLLLAIVLFSISLVVYFLRISFIKNILNTGGTAKGKIVDFEFDRGRGYVMYRYTVDKKTYTTRNAITKVNSLQKNQAVSIRYNQANPKQAFIQDIYV